MGVSLNAEEKATFDRYWPSLLTYMTEMQQTWVLGAQDVDTGWDAYKKADSARLRRGHQDHAIGLRPSVQGGTITLSIMMAALSPPSFPFAFKELERNASLCLGDCQTSSSR